MSTGLSDLQGPFQTQASAATQPSMCWIHFPLSIQSAAVYTPWAACVISGKQAWLGQ